MEIPRFYWPPRRRRWPNLPGDLLEGFRQEGTRRAFSRWKWWLLSATHLLPYPGILLAPRLANWVGMGDSFVAEAVIMGVSMTPGLLAVIITWGYYANARLDQHVAAVMVECGYCGGCGYPMAGNVSGNVSGTCPECGTRVMW